MNGKTVAIIGAGPVGLAAAAHVLERGMSPIVLEAGPEAGHAIRQWQHVQLFSPWEYNVDKAAARLLAPTGWNSPDPSSYPTGGELLDRYVDAACDANATARGDPRHPVASRPSAASALTRRRRRGVSRRRSKSATRTAKVPKSLRADAVIDTSGTWFSPNPAGGNGLPAIGERECAGRIAYGMPDVRGAGRARYAGKTVAVLGAGHSAVGTLIDLVHLARRGAGDASPIWLLRGADPAKAFGGGRNDKLAARGELGSAFAALVDLRQDQGRNRIRRHAPLELRRSPRDRGRLPVAAREAWSWTS